MNKSDADFVVLTKPVRILRADVLTVRPQHNGRGACVVTRTHSRGIRVCEDYAEVMYRISVGAVACGSVANPVKSVSELAKRLAPTDETAVQVLRVLERKKGIFWGTSSDLAGEIAGTNRDSLLRLFNCRSVGKSLSKWLPVFDDFFVVHKPRLRQGRTYYTFDGLRCGVIW